MSGPSEIIRDRPNQVLALRGIDLSVSRGELLMLVGPSGCGKTTLISIMTGVLNSTAGACQVLGRDLAEMSERERTRYKGKEIGFVCLSAVQSFANLIATPNVALPLLLGGTPYRDAVRQADAALARVGLGDRTQATPRELSGGRSHHSPVACGRPSATSDQRRWAFSISICVIAELKQIGELPVPSITLYKQHHRAGSPFIKKRIVASQWFRSVEGAVNTIQKYEALHMINKGQIRRLRKGDIAGQVQFVNRAFGLAA